MARGPEFVTQVPVLPARTADSHKGTYGRVLVVAGSRGMSGAAVLCASAALRGGAGLVTLAVPEGILGVVAAANPCYLTAGLVADESGRLAGEAIADVLSLAAERNVVALGPGLGRGPGPTAVVREVLRRVAAPVVLDADGINAVDEQMEWLSQRPGPLVLTPHPGEFGRLVGRSTRDVQARRQDLAMEFAAQHGMVLVLKGHGTVVTDGRRVYVNTSGNPGMASGGTGDVLTGLIAALIGQGLGSFDAAVLGVHRHGLAGDLARDDLGEVGMIASDLLDYLPRASRVY